MKLPAFQLFIVKGVFFTEIYQSWKSLNLPENKNVVFHVFQFHTLIKDYAN